MGERESGVIKGVPLSKIGGNCPVFSEKTDFRHDWEVWHGVRKCRKCGKEEDDKK